MLTYKQPIDMVHVAPCGLRGCKNRAHTVSSTEVVKGVYQIRV